MGSNTPDLSDKVISIFTEFVGDRAGRLSPIEAALEARAKIAQTFHQDCPGEIADDIAFHLIDWNSDAAFLVALYLFPERFSPEDVRRGVINLLVHAPNHMAAAAKLAGHPISDVFELGDLLGD